MVYPRLVNSGFTFLNMENSSVKQTKQIVIIGVSRGGTSAVAGSLYHLGVHVGDMAQPPVFEDAALSEAFEKGKNHDVVSLIKKYDSEHTVWGWKRPDSIEYLTKIDSLLSNPHYIFIFRDIFSIANRKVISRQLDLFQQMDRALDLYRTMLSFATTTKRPAMLVSAEKILTKKREFIDALISGFELDSSETQRRDACSFITTDPAEYLAKTVFTKSVGFVDELSRKRIRGWAKSEQHNKPLTVEIYFDDVLFSSILANQYREGLKSKGIHPAGLCAFDIDMTNLKLPNNQVKVEVIVQGDVAPLKGGEAYI
jgi:hypothetical protein